MPVKSVVVDVPEIVKIFKTRIVGETKTGFCKRIYPDVLKCLSQEREFSFVSALFYYWERNELIEKKGIMSEVWVNHKKYVSKPLNTLKKQVIKSKKVIEIIPESSENQIVPKIEPVPQEQQESWLTTKEVAKNLGISNMRLSQIIEKLQLKERGLVIIKSILTNKGTREGYLWSPDAVKEVIKEIPKAHKESKEKVVDKFLDEGHVETDEFAKEFQEKSEKKIEQFIQKTVNESLALAMQEQTKSISRFQETQDKFRITIIDSIDKKDERLDRKDKAIEKMFIEFEKRDKFIFEIMKEIDTVKKTVIESEIRNFWRNVGKTESPPEMIFLMACSKYFLLRKIVPQKKIGKFRIDFMFKDLICIEINSKAWHSGTQKQYEDTKRQRFFQKKGKVCITFWVKEIYEDVSKCLLELTNIIEIHKNKLEMNDVDFNNLRNDIQNNNLIKPRLYRPKSWKQIPI
jgi:very-short-patch-repair endonuclease